MTGLEALAELSKGKKIRCVNWKNPNWHFLWHQLNYPFEISIIYYLT